MSILLFLDRVGKKISRSRRKAVFRRYIGCPHKDFSLVGEVTLINRRIKLGRGVTIYPGCMFFGDGPIEIGDNVDIGKDVIIYSSAEGGGVSIGSDTMIAAQSYIIDMDHGTAEGALIREQTNSAAPVVIGRDCWLAANVTVLKGSRIGDGAVIGAKALVKGEIKPNSICVGVPARRIGERK